MTALTAAQAAFIDKNFQPSIAKKYGIATRIRALEIAATITAGTEGQLYVVQADTAPDAVTLSGDATINAAGALTIGANKILAGKVKTKTIAVTVTGGGATGTVTDADAINGVILGVYPSAGADTGIASVALTAGTGKIDVVMTGNQTGDTTVQVVVLRAT